MADDLIRAYLDAQHRYQQGTNRVETIVANIAAIANHLRFWKTVVIGGCGGFSMDMMRAPDLDVREHNWPDLQVLRQAMIDWHTAKLAVRNAWSRVPQQDRAGLRPPDGQ